MALEKRIRLFYNLIAAASVDGSIGEEERSALAWYGRQLEVDEANFVTALVLGTAGQLKVVMPHDPEERAWTLETLAKIVHADGEVKPRERQLLLHYARRMGLSSAELERIIRNEAFR